MPLRKGRVIDGLWNVGLTLVIVPLDSTLDCQVSIDVLFIESKRFALPVLPVSIKHSLKALIVIIVCFELSKMGFYD